MKVKFRLCLVPQSKVVDGVKSHRRSCRYAHSDTGFGFPDIKLVGANIVRLFEGTAICFSCFTQPSLHRIEWPDISSTYRSSIVAPSPAYLIMYYHSNAHICRRWKRRCRGISNYRTSYYLPLNIVISMCITPFPRIYVPPLSSPSIASNSGDTRLGRTHHEECNQIA